MAWPYDVDPSTYIQQALRMPLGQIPWFRSQQYIPPPTGQQSPLRQQLASLFGNALMSQQQFPQLLQFLMQNPDYTRGQLGLLAPTQSYSPVQNFWRINWNVDPDGGANNTSAASGGKSIQGQTQQAMNLAAGSSSGSANGATGDSSGSATGEAGSVGAGVGTAAGEAGATAASVSGGSDASTGGPL